MTAEPIVPRLREDDPGDLLAVLLQLLDAAVDQPAQRVGPEIERRPREPRLQCVQSRGRPVDEALALRGDERGDAPR